MRFYFSFLCYFHRVKDRTVTFPSRDAEIIRVWYTRNLDVSMFEQEISQHQRQHSSWSVSRYGDNLFARARARARANGSLERRALCLRWLMRRVHPRVSRATLRGEIETREHTEESPNRFARESVRGTLSWNRRRCRL